MGAPIASVQGLRQRANRTFENHHEAFRKFDETKGPAYVPPKVVVVRPAMNCGR
jgi:hypothetical protein